MYSAVKPALKDTLYNKLLSIEHCYFQHRDRRGCDHIVV